MRQTIGAILFGGAILWVLGSCLWVVATIVMHDGFGFVLWAGLPGVAFAVGAHLLFPAKPPTETKPDEGHT